MGRDKVHIVEVGPRDGLQNLKAFVDTEKKVSLIKRLAECGLPEIEVGGFVHPKAIPQFQDIQEMVKEILDIKGSKLMALVPNLTGAQNAVKCGITKIVFVFSVSRSHNMNNVKRTPEESIEEMKKIKAWTASSCPNVEIRLNLATVFGCPFEKVVEQEEVLKYVEKTAEAGVFEITLCDTVGYGNPQQVEEIVGRCMEQYPAIAFGVHFHNTRGLGLANNLAAYKSGIRSFDSSIGGLGGCPFAPGASGNVATEDAVFMFNEMGVITGVDMNKILDVSRYLKEILPGVPLASAVALAGVPWQSAAPCCH